MSEWEVKQLHELTEFIGRGISPKYCKENGLLVINQKCIRNGRVDLTFSKLHNSILKVVSDKKLLRLNDTLVNSTGVGTLGRVGLFRSTDAATVDSHVTIVRAGVLIDRVFLFYNLYCRQDEIESMGEGSTGQTELSRHRLGNLNIRLPKKEQQQVIAEVLSSIDDKIDLLNRQNETLEAMAQTLFRQWFIEEADDSWEETTIGKVLQTVLGGTPKTSIAEYWNGHIPWINSGEVNKFRITEGSKFITELALKKSNTELLPKGTTVIAITGATLGQISLLEINTCANQSVIGIIPNQQLPYWYVYLWVHHVIGEIVMNETGGAQGHINKGDLNGTQIVIPTNSKIYDANVAFTDMFEKISNNILEIKSLTAIRDVLLPKLMSGEVRVKLD